MQTEMLEKDDFLAKVDLVINRLKKIAEDGDANGPKGRRNVKADMRLEARALLSLIADQPETSPELVDLMGVQGGTEVFLAKIPLPPKFKMHEIAVAQFGPIEDDSDSTLCIGAMEEFYDWLKANGMAI